MKLQQEYSAVNSCIRLVIKEWAHFSDTRLNSFRRTVILPTSAGRAA